MTMTAGTRLGPYEILGPLGAGGMGQVYRGRDTRLDRQVAIKILSPHVSGDADFKARFEREARLISALNHPNICTLHDLGESDGRGYLVMELCEGESLAERLSGGPLPIEQILLYGTQIADALDRAHRTGIIHRDLKPANIMLTRSGAKLLDFGLAKPSLAVGGDDATFQKSITAEGSIVGTLQYMAPEQFEGAEADARSDIFAFGCVLYEMATGKRPFDGKTRASLIASIMEREPAPISSLVPLTPPALQRVIKTALAKDPEERWQSAHDMLLELRWVAEAGSEAGVAAPVVVRRKKRERLAWTLAAVAGMLAITSGALLWREYARPEQSFALNLSPPSGTAFMLAGPDSGSLTISPDGRFVTFAAKEEGGKTLLWLREVDSPTARPLTGTEGGKLPFWSPDSRFLAFFADDKLKKISIAGGPPLALANVQLNPRNGSWNEEGVILFSPNSLSSIHKVAAAGGPVTEVTKLSQGETTHRWATFLPDGKHFLYFAGSHGAPSESETNAIYVRTLDNPQPKLLLHARSNAVYSKGHLLFVRDRVLMAQPLDLKALAWRGDPVPVAANLQYDPGFFRGSFAASPGGALVYRTGTATTDLQLTWVDRGGKRIADVGESTGWGDIALSPDGKTIIAQIHDHATGRAKLWTYDLERNIRARSSFETLSDFDPTWSRDGSQVLYAGIAKQVWDLYIKPASGSGRAQLLYASDVNKRPTDWSPDYVAFYSFDAQRQKFGISLLPMQGEKKPIPFMPSDFNMQGLRFSPDGKWALYRSDESGANEIYLVPFPGPGGKWQVSQGGGVLLGDWYKDGREIIYNSEAGLFAVDVAVRGSSVEIGAPRLLFRDPLAVGGDITSDGERFLLAREPVRKIEEPVTIATNWMALLRK